MPGEYGGSPDVFLRGAVDNVPGRLLNPENGLAFRWHYRDKP